MKDLEAMNTAQQSLALDTAAWTLMPGQVRRFVTGPGPRRLQVTEGRLWLTLDGARGEPAHDVWLEAGEAIELPSGARLLLEGWPQAGFTLLVPPSACPAWQQLATGRPAGWLSRAVASLAGASGPGPWTRWAS